MYRLNPLERNVLITTDEVIFHAPTKQTLDPRTIQQAIIIAEERFITPALGFTFYQDMIDKKNVEITSLNIEAYQARFSGITLAAGNIVNAFEHLSSDYLMLWKYLLWKITAECVLFTAYPDSFIQFGSEGIVHTAAQAGPMNSAGVVTPELRSVKWAMDKKLVDRIGPLLDALHVYFCSNLGKYSLYTRPCLCDDSGNKAKRSDIVLGIYDDVDTKGCGCYD